MGEILRSSFAKRYTKKYLPWFRKRFRAAHQWGVGIPGACESLAHWRSTVEELALAGTIPAVVAMDVDMVNMFGSVEWDSMRASIDPDQHPEIASWIAWHQKQAAVTVLPSREEFECDRGAEQGDGFGTLQAGLVLADARQPFIQDDTSSSSSSARPRPLACEQWYIDDGQAFLRPCDVDPWLRALDASMATFGGTRGTISEGTAKSSCRLLCPTNERHAHQGWDTEYVRSTCKVLEIGEPSKALGAPIGGQSALNTEVGDVVRKTQALRASLVELLHTPTELVLTRKCIDVAKLSYHLRLNGDRIESSALDLFDRNLRDGLETILGGHLEDDAWAQCAIAINKGGLGLRTANQVALAAFIASRITSRPHVHEMAQHLQSSGLGDAQIVMTAYDQRTGDAMVTLMGNLDPSKGAELIDELENSLQRANETWQNLFAESDETPRRMGADPRQPGPPRHLGSTVLPLDEDADEEHPHASLQSSGSRLQRVIMGFIDQHCYADVLARHDVSQNLSATRRLEDLSHEECDHQWLWNLSPHKGPIMDSRHFVEAVRVRLGAAGPSESALCNLCGGEFVDRAGSHALCCSRAEATRGHNAVARHIMEVAKVIDPSTEAEAQGLIPGTSLRPADVLTGALNNGSVALDIGITSPDASNAGEDCTASMYARKVATYAMHTDTLDRQNIEYQPLIWSAYGRPHPRSTVILRTLATRFARRRDCSDGKWRYRRLRGAIGSEIWLRAASQVIACWPGGDEDGDEDMGVPGRPPANQ